MLTRKSIENYEILKKSFKASEEEIKEEIKWWMDEYFKIYPTDPKRVYGSLNWCIDINRYQIDEFEFKDDKLLITLRTDYSSYDSSYNDFNFPLELIFAENSLEIIKAEKIAEDNLKEQQRKEKEEKRNSEDYKRKWKIYMEMKNELEGDNLKND